MWLHMYTPETLTISIHTVGWFCIHILTMLQDDQKQTRRLFQL